ncbi:DUF805 domain-containing protein [Xanthobacter sp. DSM 24535]|uniref:DUF805 domain-containing protein n=1 Tax=Roseixanthobacter psychrophilus TaxID=3119917 RepID=UPI003727C678
MFNSYLSVMRQYATFTGRASRKEFWLYTLVVFLLSVVAEVLDMLLFGGQVFTADGMVAVESYGILTGIVHLIHIVPSIAVGVRRLHDIDRTGWWLLLVFTGIGMLVILIFNVLSGTRGPNRFGPDPLGYPTPSFPTPGSISPGR